MFVKFETHSNFAGKRFNFSAVIHKKGKLISFKNNSEKLANVKTKSKLVLFYLLLQMIIVNIGRILITLIT